MRKGFLIAVLMGGLLGLVLLGAVLQAAGVSAHRQVTNSW